MDFEILSSGGALWTGALVAPCYACKLARGVVPWFAGGRVSRFGLVRRCIGDLIFSFAFIFSISFAGGRVSRFGLVRRRVGDLIFSFAASFVDCPIFRFNVRRRGISLVQQIDCELLARPLGRQRQLLRARGSASEVCAGPLSLPGLSVPFLA